ncbi:MAG: hypothetical protein PHD50_02705 [Bacilli bacterium]|nr:hypothetical protein [Bacilli bacterium]
MKKIIILMFIAVVVFAGCNKQDKETEKMYEEYVNKAKTSEIKETKCFLGFHFGWSKQEYYSYMDSLVLSNKVYEDGGSYYYDYHTNVVIYKLQIKPEFYNDTLYRMLYATEDKSAYLFFVSGFMNSQKDFMPFVIPNIIDNEIQDYYYIKDNMVIEFSQFVGSDFSYMKYTNAPIECKIDSIEKAKEKESEKEF